MARPSKLDKMSPAEKAEAKANLKTVLKSTDTALKAAVKAKRDAAALLNKVQLEARKGLAAAAKVHDTAVKAALKDHDAAVKRHDKAIDAATKGIEKVKTQLAAFEAPVASTEAQQTAQASA